MVVTPRPQPTAGTETVADIDGRISAQLFAAITSAHARLRREDGGAFVAAWDRPIGSRDFRILIGGRPNCPVAQDDSLLFPPGSQGIPVDSEQLARQWDSLSWIRCTGRPDALWTPTDGATAPGRGGFEDYIAHLPGAFAWLVVAEPLSPAALDEDLMRLEIDLSDKRSSPGWEPARLAVTRGEGRHRELSRAMSTGMWNLHVLVGAADDAAAHAAAGLLCSAVDLDQLPYTLRPNHTGEAATLLRAWENPIPATESGFTSPFIASAELVVALTHPPRRELPGVRVVEPALFDVTPETGNETTAFDGIPVGDVLDAADRAVGEFAVSRDTLNRHTFVAGATGSGKSQTVRRLLDGLHTNMIPWLVIEPAKAEYSGMAGRIGAPVTVIRPGDAGAVPVGINPLEPEPGFPLQTHIDLTRALFLAAFDAVEPFPQVLSHALLRCYTDLGWNPMLSASALKDVTPKYPSLGDLQRIALDVVEGIGYSREITDNVRGFIDVRIGSLRLGTPGRFFEGGYLLDLGDLLSRNAVLEIEDIGNDSDKAFLIGAILIRIYEHLRTHPGTGSLRHVTVIEEAHRLLKRAEPGTPAAHAVELFTALLAEIRSYGEGLVVAEQIPAKISPDVIKNTALKIVHRLPAAEDRDMVGATMNLDDAQSRHVVSLPPGRAAIFADGMDRPIRIRVPLREHLESVDSLGATTPSENPLILRDLEKARLLADDPRLIVGMELLIIAHLVGEPAPIPSKVWLDAFVGHVDGEIVRAAFAHRIRTGIDARYAGISAHYQPETLTDHLHHITDAWLDGNPPHTDEPSIRWQAGPFRWTDIERALISHPDTDRPHPDTGSWTARGMHLPGTTTAEQLHQLRAHPDTWSPAPTVITGRGTPPLILTAIASLTNATTLAQRLHQATAHLHLPTQWPLAILDLAGAAR
ncbi:ATP-binding protein [Nocardia concava]|uniref:ATP-binding protein n=1 Tax=Nocardia concava TaxID=257281 RepID=UPI0002FB5E91